MHHPHQRDRERDVGRTLRVRRAHSKSPRRNGEEEQRIDDMNRDIEEAIPTHVQLAKRVVERERQADERPSR
jgi:hypothetical protein